MKNKKQKTLYMKDKTDLKENRCFREENVSHTHTDLALNSIQIILHPLTKIRFI